MPRELIAVSPGECALREYEEPPLGPDQIRVNSLFSAVKHGTEFRTFQSNTKDAEEHFSWEWRMHLRGEKGRSKYPMGLGNMFLAEVTEVGREVADVRPGERVFGHAKVSETHTLKADSYQKPPEGMTWEAIMYEDPAGVALCSVRDAHIRLGDRVAVFGLGAIGLMTVQLARVAGARWVAAIDPIEKRRAAAETHGVDLTIDPTQVDAGYEIKKATDKLGVDVAMETSGSSHAMNDALRALRYEGTVVSSAYYNAPMAGLNLAGEWHRNRPTITSVRSDSEPWLDFGWDKHRGNGEAFKLLAEGRLRAEGLIDPVVGMEDCAEAYMRMVSHPETGIKLGVDHSL